MKKKIVVILLLAALLVATGVVLAGPGEDSDIMKITVTKWDTPFGKEGGDEGIFLGLDPIEF
jgi:hypothetical protein